MGKQPMLTDIRKPNASLTFPLNMFLCRASAATRSSVVMARSLVKSTPPHVDSLTLMKLNRFWV